MTTAMRRLALMGGTLLAIALGAGCGEQTERAPEQGTLETFVGRVAGGAAYIAVITDGERLSGFVTDGKQSAKWFATIGLDDGEAPLIARDGYELGKATISGDSAEGEISLGITKESFQIRRATGDAGLFSAAERRGENSFEAGWIVLPDGSESGTYDTTIDGKFTTHPAPELRPTVTIKGFGSQAPHQQSSLFLDQNTQAP